MLVVVVVCTVLYVWLPHPSFLHFSGINSLLSTFTTISKSMMDKKNHLSSKTGFSSVISYKALIYN